MKTRPCHLAASLLAALLAATSGCAKEPPAPAPVAADTPAAPLPPPTVAPAAQLDPFEEMDRLLETATFQQHDGLSLAQVRLDRSLGDRLAAWKAAGHSVSVEADEKFTGVRRDFADKLRLLTLADETSWPNAKHNTEMGLQDVRSFYHGIMTDPAPEKKN